MRAKIKYLRILGVHTFDVKKVLEKRIDASGILARSLVSLSLRNIKVSEMIGC